MDQWLQGLAFSRLPWPATLAVVLVTVAITKGIDRLIKLRQANHSIHSDVIQTILDRLGDVEEDLKAERISHMECQKELGLVRGDLGMVKGRVDQITRDWNEALSRHDKVQQEHIERLKKRTLELEEELRLAGLPIANPDEETKRGH